MPLAGFAASAGFASGDWASILNKVLDTLLVVLGFAVAIGVVISGFFFVTAKGDPAGVKTARDFLLWSLIGLGAGFLAFILINLVSSLTGGTFTR